MADILTDDAVVKLSANLPQSTVDKLRRLAAARKTTMTDILRRAIETESFLTDVILNNGKILVEESDKSLKQVVFR